MLSNVHMMLFLTAFLAKCMFRIISHFDLRINHGCDMTKYFMTCQRIFYHIIKIFHDMKKYFAMSLNNIHVVDEYTKNIP
jgi:hypothetical protein